MTKAGSRTTRPNLRQENARINKLVVRQTPVIQRRRNLMPQHGFYLAQNHVPRHSADVRRAAVVGIVAVVAHQEIMSFRHDVRAVVAVRPCGQEFLGVLHAVDVQVAAGNLNRIARQTHHALDKIRAAAVRIAAHHDIEALRLAAKHNRLIEEVRRAVMQLAHNHDFAVVQRRIHADRKSTRLNSSHVALSRMPSSA